MAYLTEKQPIRLDNILIQPLALRCQFHVYPLEPLTQLRRIYQTQMHDDQLLQNIQPVLFLPVHHLNKALHFLLVF